MQQNYKNKEDEQANSGLIVPLLPFGMPKFDAGERFDLRSPYADDGWVDPDETGDSFWCYNEGGRKKKFYLLYLLACAFRYRSMHCRVDPDETDDAASLPAVLQFC
jgi:hypothetical protein